MGMVALKENHPKLKEQEFKKVLVCNHVLQCPSIGGKAIYKINLCVK